MEKHGQSQTNDDVAPQQKLPFITGCVADCIWASTVCRTISLAIWYRQVTTFFKSSFSYR